MKTMFFSMVLLLFSNSILATPNISNDHEIVWKDQDGSIISSILATYKKNTSQTPDYYIVPLQKAIYQYKETFSGIYSILKDPTQIGPAIVQYLKNPEISVEGLKNLIYQELSLSNQNLLAKMSPSDVLQYVETIAKQYEQNCEKIMPDIVFRPESGLFFRYKDIPYVFVSNFSSKHGEGTRIKEVLHNREWFASQGYNVIDIPNELPFEGGAEVKYVKHGDSVDFICGWGYRTDLETISWISDRLSEILKEDFKKVNIVPVHMISEEYYHLDTALKEIPVIENGEIVGETIMYYPQAFDENTQLRLKQLYPNALILSEHDAQNFASNSPTIDKSIIIDERVSNQLQCELRDRGIKVITIDLSEFFKAGGGGKCLICELDSDLFKFEACCSNKIQMIGSTVNIFDVVYINDPYMLSCIGTINKGLAQKQHENLIKTLQKEGCEIFLMDPKKFQEPMDFETLRKATYNICMKTSYINELDDVIIEAMKHYGKEDIVASKYSMILPQIYNLYDEVFHSESTYSWASLALAIQEMKKQQYQKGIDGITIRNTSIETPEDFLPYFQ
ncbi:MAG: Arginine deiminase [Candidatus Anoxychlamydiales bacterium]|nr:Arginine deiminase [Candidatus Anoxychlamydiales bacterium]